MFGPAGPSLRELLAQALTSTRDGYDRLAPRFDATPFRTPPDVVAAWARHWPPAERGLDLCCGTGAATEALRAHCTGEVTGLDFSPGMLAIARERVPGVDWVQGDALDLPEALGPFDLVVSSGAFGHFRRPEHDRLLAGIHRVLRPGGVFSFLTGPRPPWWSAQGWTLRGFNAAMRVRNRLRDPKFVMYYLNFTLPEVARRLERNGFEVEIRPLGLDRPTSLRAVVARSVSVGA